MVIIQDFACRLCKVCGSNLLMKNISEVSTFWCRKTLGPIQFCSKIKNKPNMLYFILKYNLPELDRPIKLDPPSLSTDLIQFSCEYCKKSQVFITSKPRKKAEGARNQMMQYSG